MLWKRSCLHVLIWDVDESDESLCTDWNARPSNLVTSSSAYCLKFWIVIRFVQSYLCLKLKPLRFVWPFPTLLLLSIRSAIDGAGPGDQSSVGALMKNRFAVSRSARRTSSFELFIFSRPLDARMRTLETFKPEEKVFILRLSWYFYIWVRMCVGNLKSSCIFLLLSCSLVARGPAVGICCKLKLFSTKSSLDSLTQ